MTKPEPFEDLHNRIADKILKLADKDPEAYGTAAATLIAASMIVDAIDTAAERLAYCLTSDEENGDSLVAAIKSVRKAILDREP